MDVDCLFAMVCKMSTSSLATMRLEDMQVEYMVPSNGILRGCRGTAVGQPHLMLCSYEMSHVARR